MIAAKLLLRLTFIVPSCRTFHQRHVNRVLQSPSLLRLNGIAVHRWNQLYYSRRKSLASAALLAVASPVNPLVTGGKTLDNSHKCIGNVVLLIPSTMEEPIPTKFGSGSPIGNPNVKVAAQQLIRKIGWFSDGLVNATILTPEVAVKSENFRNAVLRANCLIAFHLQDTMDVKVASELFHERRRGSMKAWISSNYFCQFALECISTHNLLPMVGGYKADWASFSANFFPWTEAASAQRLQNQMFALFHRWTSDDFTSAIMLFFNQFSGREIPWVKHSIDATWEKGPIQNTKEFYMLVSKCGDCIGNCVKDRNCRTCIEKLTEIDSRDQVASYRTIISYESDLLEDFSYCILQKHNIFECDAAIPMEPKVPQIECWRGQQLTKETARRILIGHLDDSVGPDGAAKSSISWRVAAGANVAYDQFPSQHQIFYESANGKNLWYDPIFRVETIDGRHVWAKRHYAVRDGKEPGTFRFSVLDNGVTSNEFWTIAGVADDLSWVVFHYAGAAAKVGQRYIGGLICTKDGHMPIGKNLSKVWCALDRTGIEPWELFEVYNRLDSAGAIKAGPPPLDYFRKSVTEAKKK